MKIHTEFPFKQAETRYSGKFDNNISEARLKELNPYDLSRDEIEFYLNHPQLRAYKINDKEQVEKVKKMIKYLKKVQWTSTLNRIIE